MNGNVNKIRTEAMKKTIRTENGTGGMVLGQVGRLRKVLLPWTGEIPGTDDILAVSRVFTDTAVRAVMKADMRKAFLGNTGEWLRDTACRAVCSYAEDMLLPVCPGRRVLRTGGRTVIGFKASLSMDRGGVPVSFLVSAVDAGGVLSPSSEVPIQGTGLAEALRGAEACAEAIVSGIPADAFPRPAVLTDRVAEAVRRHVAQNRPPYSAEAVVEHAVKDELLSMYFEMVRCAGLPVGTADARDWFVVCGRNPDTGLFGKFTVMYYGSGRTPEKYYEMCLDRDGRENFDRMFRRAAVSIHDRAAGLRG